MPLHLTFFFQQWNSGLPNCLFWWKWGSVCTRGCSSFPHHSCCLQRGGWWDYQTGNPLSSTYILFLPNKTKPCYEITCVKYHLSELPFLLLKYLVEAPWLSNLQVSCTVVSQGVLTCIDSATVSLYTLDLHAQSQMTQMPLQVLMSTCYHCINSIISLWNDQVSQFFLFYIFSFIFLKTLGLELAPGFHPTLVSSQPNPSHPPLSEFLLQLGPDHYLLLQLNNGHVVTLRDLKPVCNFFFNLPSLSYFRIYFFKD